MLKNVISSACAQLLQCVARPSALLKQTPIIATSVRNYNADQPKKRWMHERSAISMLRPVRPPTTLVENPFMPPLRADYALIREKNMADIKTLFNTHMGLPKPSYARKFPIVGKPQAKAVVVKVMIKKPKKPNSANRRCCRVRFANGKEATAHIPGEGHNLQEHSVVLVRNGRCQDLIGVKLKVIRGKLDCAPVKKRVVE